jgi:TPR repeat protein
METDEDKREMKRAFELYMRAAELGVAPACLNVSNFFAVRRMRVPSSQLGVGTEADEVKANQWLRVRRPRAPALLR